MKQSKFSLADVLNVLTALAFGFICFLGENFSTLGNTSLSIMWAVFITISLAGTVFVAKLLKQTSRNFRTNFVLEIVALVLFTSLMFFFTYTSFSHYFNVSAKKTEIQGKLQLSITQAENMFALYEQYVERRKNGYRGNLQSAVDGKGTAPSEYANYCFVNGQVPDYVQIDSKMFTLHTLLFPTNYSDSTTKKGIKDVATTWLNNAKIITNSWSPVSIASVINNVENNSISWRTQLIELSKQGECGETYLDFDSKLSFGDVKIYFTTYSKPTPLSVGLAVVAYLLMLLSWFVTKRDSRSIGASGTASYEVIL
jgi:hypothetical protein